MDDDVITNNELKKLQMTSDPQLLYLSPDLQLV